MEETSFIDEEIHVCNFIGCFCEGNAFARDCEGTNLSFSSF